ncbi:uncharacterized protein BX663DRAFT_531112 [Cokeromyces recurvatus]|uniref:uncharacterized protein n=1 Tax=Cokeromyces recurvatus TaxID=90255 RepID=UPI00222077D8|nr:uncharacterized protein BX663DRAFT_531112 [Cokeromyces recurvatus]KAI7903017.1 hypothetical protein BX663DRAFT_531112 [Cokeromyces recurvatus]
MSYSQNRFNALLNEEETEIDKLGNTKPVQKKDNDKLPTRREMRRSSQRGQVAVSPPSRRDRGSRREATEGDASTSNYNHENPARSDKSGGRFEYAGRGRQFDRHSGTGIYDNEKKINRGWGEAGTAEFQGAHDVLDPNDPDAAETGTPRAETPQDNTKTLDEYLQEKKNTQNFRLEQGRKPNEGVDDSEWKDAVVLEKEEGAYFVGKETETKLKSKNKKEKVYLEINQPSHRPSRGGQRQGRGGRNNQRNNRSTEGTLNLSDSTAFPTLGA